jgi:hypothetical protein
MPTTPVQQAVGNTFQDAGYGTVDNRFYSRGPLAAVLIRDYLGASTNISPYVQGGSGPVLNWTPLTADGQLRTDLFADVLIGGNWYINTAPNQGFWRIGAIDEKGGIDRKGAIKHDDEMILQSNFPFDTDLTGEGKTIAFSGVEAFKPAMVRLKLNLPLSNLVTGANLVEDVGQPNYVISKPVDADSVNRQILCVFARPRPGGYIYSVEGYPLVKLTDIGTEKRSKTDSDSASLTFTALPSPFHTDVDPTNPTSPQVVQAFYTQWIGGTGWTSMFEHGS